MRFIGIIPARYASTRFPGKPLADLCGKPVIQRVYEQVSQVLDTLVVATDDERIYDAVSAFGGKVVMTRPDHRCGTERCLEAYHASTTPAYRAQNNEDTVIINIQGDEPFIHPEQIEALMACFPTEIATLAKPFTAANTPEELENPNSPKVVFDPKDHHALLFSRSVIPHLRGVEREQWPGMGQHYRHIGLYAYRADVLEQITQLEPTPLEKAESLEQLRWLENGYTIRVALTDQDTIGIDTPEDLKRAVEHYRKYGI